MTDSQNSQEEMEWEIIEPEGCGTDSDTIDVEPFSWKGEKYLKNINTGELYDLEGDHVWLAYTQIDGVWDVRDYFESLVEEDW